MSSNYQSWLERQGTLVKKALELIQSFKFRVVIIGRENKPSFIRLYLGGKRIDFYIKEIKCKFARNIWLCPREEFNPKNNYLIFISDIERWRIGLGSEIERRAELRDSDYHKGVKYIVAPMEIFRSAKVFFKSVMSRYEQSKQKRMTDWI